MAGTWQSVDGSAFEYWSIVKSGMRGLSLTLKDSSLRPSVQEKMEIYRKEGDLVFFAEPLNQRKTEFVIAESNASFFRAENPDHDFPKWIIYEVNRGGDSMFARIGDANRSVNFVFIKSKR